MFMQFSVDKNGLVAGAYKNVMTGDEQPIVGQVDKKTQRVAWHIGDATNAVYETGPLQSRERCRQRLRSLRRGHLPNLAACPPAITRDSAGNGQTARDQEVMNAMSK
jgi:hypothetical protein